tara:strand:- start:290 stop:691 length:402 start_codon:yes stop_codon:yes gene_type:complete
MIKPNELAGRVRVAYGLYEASAEQSDIHMFNLPNGARIISGELVHDALGSSTTASVGHAAYTNSAGTAVAADVDEYKAAAASTSITTVACAATTALGKFSVIDADKSGIPITVSIAGANGTGTVELVMLYVVD